MRVWLFAALLALSGCATEPRAAAPDTAGMAAVVLERRNPDPRGLTRIDGIVFFRPAGFRYVRRLDGDHVVAIGAAGAAPRPALTADEAKAAAALIAENGLRPRRAGDGLIVYCPPRPCYVFSSRGAGGETLLEVRERLQGEWPGEPSRALPGER